MLNNRTTKASLWTIISFGASQFLRLFSNLILTRLLMPEAFGLMAIVTVVRMGVYMCSEIGLKVNVIRHENGEAPEILNTAWTMQVIRGVILWLVICLIAWVIANAEVLGIEWTGAVYSDPRLPLLLMVMGFTAVISGFESTKVWLAQRNLELSKLTLIEVGTQFFGLIVMVIFAWLYNSVWALVIGGLVGEVLKVCSSYLFLTGKNNYFYWNKAIVIEFLHFGKWLFLSALITFFALNGDRVILGGLLTAEQVGIYSIAFFLATSARDLIGKLTTNVWYPLLSQVNRENKSALIDTYYKIRSKLDVLVYFLVGFLFVTAPLIIDVLYDERYEDAGWMLQVLSITVIGASFTLGSTLLLSMGNPKLGTISVAVRAVALLIMLPYGYEYYGIEGALWAIAVNPLFESIVILWSCAMQKIIRWKREFRYVPVTIVGYTLGQIVLTLSR